MAYLELDSWADTPEKKVAWADVMEEFLRLRHNIMGAWWQAGISLTVYNTLPSIVKARFPFVPGEKLSDEQWKDFLHDWECGHNPSDALLSDLRAECKELNLKNVALVVSLETGLKEGKKE